MAIEASNLATRSLVKVDQNKLKDDFLTLLLAEMKYSDPLEPQDNLSFTEQLATFAMMEQVAGINSKFESLTREKVESTNTFENVNLLSSYINHNVEAISDKINIQEGKGILFYELKNPANKVQINIMNQGEIVYSTELANQSSGFHNFDVDDSQIKNGKYAVQVVAFDELGNQVKVGNTIENKVDGINLAKSTPLLMVGNLNVDPSNIIKIRRA